MNDKLNEALDHIGDVHLYESTRVKPRRLHWISAAVAVLALICFLIPMLRKQDQPTDPHVESPGTTTGSPATSQPIGSSDPVGGIDMSILADLPNLLAAPIYPEMVQRPGEDFTDWKAYSAAMDAWQKSQNAQYDQPEGYASSLTDFFLESTRQFLSSEQNSAYSPLNVYMALAMLTETTDGNSRQQLLDLLGLDSIEALRQQAGHVWNAHYSDDGATTLLMGSSLWLDEAFSFHQSCVDRLANDYYAAAFRGDLGTDAMNEQLQAWLNANTGGLLKDQAEDIKLNPNTVFSLAATIYFKAGWENEFREENNQEMIFHSAQGDLTATFMGQTYTGHTYYWGENFSAIRLALSGENGMWLILPDEGYTVADILASDDYLRMTMDPNGWENKGLYKVHLRLPKFDVVSSTDLIPGLKNMGITDVFDSTISDFTAMTDTPRLFVSGATHAARVVIDEQGCLAAAFTVITVDNESVPPQYPEIEFTLDRPFLFVISSRDDLPLFTGTVCQP